MRGENILVNFFLPNRRPVPCLIYFSVESGIRVVAGFTETMTSSEAPEDLLVVPASNVTEFEPLTFADVDWQVVS